MYKSRSQRFFLWVAVLFGAVCPLSLQARDIRIIVLDQELGIPLEGAEIRSFDGKTYLGDQEGSVVLTAPDDQTVIIRGTYPGYESERVVIEPDTDECILELRLTGTLEAEELVLEENRPPEDVDMTGRGLALGDTEEEEIRHTREPVFIEIENAVENAAGPAEQPPEPDYPGRFNTTPGMWGRQSGNLMAVMNGFYIEKPSHWGGSLSIFDPRMAESARTSHGVFSTRYGYTVSGLLDIALASPSSRSREFELDLSTNAAAARLSLPIADRGGLIFTGLLSYYDPVLWAARGISGALEIEALRSVESVSTAPYVRSAALHSTYRFTESLELGLTGFFGADGAGTDYKDEAGDPAGSLSVTELKGRWANYQGFGLLSLNYNPRPGMVLKAGLGAGYFHSEVEGRITYYSAGTAFDDVLRSRDFSLPVESYFGAGEGIFPDERNINVQGRVDFDWDLGRGFAAALGLQEIYTHIKNEAELPVRVELSAPEYNSFYGTSYPTDYVSYWKRLEAEKTRVLASSGYLLMNYGSPERRFQTELGLRLDHFRGDSFSTGSGLSLSPRFDLDLNLLRDRGPFRSLSLSLGAGLFSSAGDLPAILQIQDVPGDQDIKPDRSVTAQGGINAELAGGLNIDIEGYYTYVFNRGYAFTNGASSAQNLYFDGQGRMWGFDLVLKKTEGRRLDGWVSYSFNSTQYREPAVPDDLFSNAVYAVSNDWYYPAFHRFHELNLILNIKPTDRFAITTRLGFTSGLPGDGQSYSVTALDENGNPGAIHRRKRIAGSDKGSRTGFSVPLDIKFSFFNFTPRGKSRQEFYAAVENVLSPIHHPGNNIFNPYDIPIPIPSLGFTWSF
ncbi:MAG: hypothetical protein LBL56_01985 [Treponema sp.]|jgi:hypothetical protein|nr:hypothetical protein [Treponema sp.]